MRPGWRLRTVVLALAAAGTANGIARADFWEPTAGPYGGYVRRLLVLSPDTLVAGTSFGGVYRSADGGVSWTSSADGLSDLHVFELLEAPGGALYAGTYGGGVCRSADRGAHWVPVNAGLTRLQVWCLAASHSDTIYAGTYQGGVFRSVDAGGSWTSASNGLGSAAALDVRSLVVHPDGRLFAGTYDFVYRSNDAANSWTQARTGLGNTYCWSLAVRNDGLLAVGTPNGCWLSSSGGDLWTPSGLSVNTSVLTLDSRPNGELFAGCGSGIWWSGNDGLGWTQRNAGLTSTDIACVRVGPGALVYAGSSGGGAFRSADNGLSWTAAGAGIQETHAAALALAPSGTWYAGTDGGVFRSTDLGAQWTLTSLTNWHVAALAAGGVDVVAATAGGGVYHSSNAGATWTAAGSSLPDPNAWALALRPSGGLFAGTSTGVARLTSFGGIWQALAGFPASTGVVSLLVDHTGVVFAGTLDSGVQRSSDDGITWTPANSGLGSQRVLSLAEDHAGRLFAGTMVNGVYRSLDQGDTWQQLPGTGGYVAALAADDGDRVFAAVRGQAVLRSLDHGDTWAMLDADLGGNEVIALAADVSHRIVAGTDHHGVYRSALPTSDAAQSRPGAVLHLAIRPNPSRAALHVQFSLPHAGHARLDVYDVAGRAVRSLWDAPATAGAQRVVWDGRDDRARRVPAGIYLTRLVTDRQVHTARIVRVE